MQLQGLVEPSDNSQEPDLRKLQSNSQSTMAKPKGRGATSEAPSDGRTQPGNGVAMRKAVAKPADYSSEGVEDHDVFLLPGSDYQIMLAVTLLAAVVRIFRIYQPSSVVFDEVQ